MRASPPIALGHLDLARPARVVGVPAADAERLAAEGIRPGDVVEIEARLPLGGPVVVRLGRARVALARRIASAILVDPEDPG